MQENGSIRLIFKKQEYYEDEADDVGKVLKVKATCLILSGIDRISFDSSR